MMQSDGPWTTGPTGALEIIKVKLILILCCDQIIILDNCSNDNTPQLISCLMSRFSHIQTYKINDYRDSHEYISSYAGTDTWAFGIDGDEVYDPRGLAIFRTKRMAPAQ